MSVKLFDRVFSLFEREKSSLGVARVFSCVVQGFVFGGSRRVRAKRGCCFFSLYLQRLFISFFSIFFFFKLSFSLIHVRQIFEYRLFFFLGFFWQSLVVLGVQQRRQAAAPSNTLRRAGVRDTIQENRAIRLFVVASIRVLRNARINVSVTVQDVKRGNIRQVSIFLVASAKR